jgi:hypothetical protein
MPRKTKILATSENLINPNDNNEPKQNATPVAKETQDEDDLVPIQADKPVPPPPPSTPKPKRERTEAQKAVTAKMKEALAAKWEKSRAEKAAAAEAHKKQVEERVVKKALAIKKRQIKEQMALEEISSDDEPIEEIIPKMRKLAVAKPRSAPVPQAPRIIFM